MIFNTAQPVRSQIAKRRKKMKKAIDKATKNPSMYATDYPNTSQSSYKW